MRAITLLWAGRPLWLMMIQGNHTKLDRAREEDGESFGFGS
jgi:hypothetical protein